MKDTVDQSNEPNFFANILGYMNLVKIFSTNMFTTFMTNFDGPLNNQHYKSIFITLLTTLAFTFKFVTTSFLNYIFMLSNLYFSTQQNTTQEHIIKLWTTYAAIVISSNLLDRVSHWADSLIITIPCEILKCTIYYKLLSDPDFPTKINNSLAQIYQSNKTCLIQVEKTTENLIALIITSLNQTISEETGQKIIKILNTGKLD